jgi:hypothetical protein
MCPLLNREVALEGCLSSVTKVVRQRHRHGMISIRKEPQYCSTLYDNNLGKSMHQRVISIPCVIESKQIISSRA